MYLQKHCGHLRHYLSPCIVKQNDFGVLTDQGHTSWKLHDSHRAAFCREHCKANTAAVYFSSGSSLDRTYGALCQSVFLK